MRTVAQLQNYAPMLSCTHLYVLSLAAAAALAQLQLTQLADPAQVGTPVTAAIRYREGAQLAALGLSPYAGAAFHGPPLLLAGARLLDAAAASAFPGVSILVPPWRVLATSATDVLAAAALARLMTAAAAAAGSQPRQHGSGGADSRTYNVRQSPRCSRSSVLIGQDEPEMT
jgi:GPI transamidase subunit PIG-U